jgi:hypothetical protein
MSELYYSKFIKELNKHHNEFGELKRDHSQPCEYQEFMDRVKEARLFILSGEDFPSAAHHNDEFIDPRTDYCLPFKTIWVEVIGKPVFIQDHQDSTWPEGTSCRTSTFGFLLHENADFKIECDVLIKGQWLPEEKDYPANWMVFDVDLSDFSVGWLSGVYKTLAFIDAAKLYPSKETRKIKVFNRKDKFERKINNLIYVSKQQSKTFNTPSGEKIEYSHRFEVRGHWRNISSDSLGKNRTGERSIVGRTWVLGHVRGDEALPLVRKTRLITAAS